MTESAGDGTRRSEGGTVPGVRVYAEDFGMDGPQGPVFHGVNIDAGPGSLIAVEGPSGSGRTCLLLALTGRMKATSGHATVARNRLPKQLAAVRRISALGPVPGITDLDPALSVTEHLRERALLQRRFGGSLKALLRPRKERVAASKALLDGALEAAGLDLDTLPKGQRTRVRELERVEELRLSLALALMGGPRLLAVDDIDLKLSAEEREQIWATLRSITESGTTVLAVCSEAPEDAVVVRTESKPQAEPGKKTSRFGRKKSAQKAAAASTGEGAGKAAGEGDAQSAGAAEKKDGEETKGEAADALA